MTNELTPLQSARHELIAHNRLCGASCIHSQTAEDFQELNVPVSAVEAKEVISGSVHVHTTTRNIRTTNYLSDLYQ